MYSDVLPIFVSLFGDAGYYLVPNYPRALFLAAVVPSLIVLKQLEKRGVDSRVFFVALMWGGIGALLGARYGWNLFNLARVDSTTRLLLGGGWSSLGGLLGGALAVTFYLQYKRRDLLFFADAMVPGVALGLGISRIGCTMAGCCFGKRSEALWAVTFPAWSPAWKHHLRADLISERASRSLPVIPTQMLEMTLWFVLAAGLFWLTARQAGEATKAGAITGLFLIGFASVRYASYYLRPWYPDDAWLTGPQFACVALFLCGMVLLFERPRNLVDRWLVAR